MIGWSRSVRVFVWADPVDMRKSYNGLAGLVIERMGRNLETGDVYLFVGKDRRRAKALAWDGTGMCLYSKRLSSCRFAAPWERGVDATVTLTLTELAAFFEGSEMALRVRLSPRELEPTQRVLRFA